MEHIEFVYDLRSPYVYMAWHRLNLIESAGVKISWRPVSIDVLLNLQAGREPWADYSDPLAPPKRQYLLADISRMARYWQVPFGPVSFKPRSKRAMCLVTAIDMADHDQSEFIELALKQLWLNARDIEEDEVFSELVSASPVFDFSDAEERLALDKLTTNTISAYESGIFGVPSFRHNDDVYFGADRMDVLAANLPS